MRVTLSAGPQSDPAALGGLPDHVVVERFVDRASLLRTVDVAVHHGGSGTVLACLEVVATLESRFG